MKYTYYKIEVSSSLPLLLLSLEELIWLDWRKQFRQFYDSPSMDFCSPRFLKIIYLVLTALGLCCCARAFSGCGECLLVAEHMQALQFVTHRLSCPAESGIFLDQPSNLCPLHWQADSHPLCTRAVPLFPQVIKTSERDMKTKHLVVCKGFDIRRDSSQGIHTPRFTIRLHIFIYLVNNF